LSKLNKDSTSAAKFYEFSFISCLKSRRERGGGGGGRIRKVLNEF